MISQTLAIIVKNIRLLLRSRASALIVILGPLFLMFLVGFSFNSVGTQDVEVGIYSQRYTPLTLSYVKGLADGPFRTLKYVSKQACVDHIKKGVLATCVIFPPDMTAEDVRIDEIEFYVDYSRVNLVYQILDRVQKEVSSVDKEVSLGLTASLLDALTDVQKEVNDTQPTLDSIISGETATSQGVRRVSANIAGLDVNFDPRSLDIEAAALGLGKAQHKVSTIYNNHQSMANKCGDAIETGLKEALSCASDEDEEDQLRRDINKTPVFVYQEPIDDAYEDIRAEFDRSKTLLDKVDKGMDTLRTDIQEIEDLRSNVRKNLSRINEEVLARRKQAEGVEETLSDIYDDIDGLQVRSANNIVTPVTTNIKPVVPETTNLIYLFPTLLAMVMMFSSVLLASTLVMAEKKSKAYFRNFIMPLSSFAQIMGTFITTLFVILLQVSIIILIANFYFQTNILNNIGSISSLLVLLASVFIVVGLFVGYLFNSEDTVTLGAITISSLFLFLSDVIMPLESMPTYISKLALYNPFVIGSQSLKKALLFSTPLEALSQYLWLFGAYVLMLLALLVLLEKLLKKRAIYKLTNQYAIRKDKKKKKQLIRFEEE